LFNLKNQFSINLACEVFNLINEKYPQTKNCFILIRASLTRKEQEASEYELIFTGFFHLENYFLKRNWSSTKQWPGFWKELNFLLFL